MARVIRRPQAIQDLEEVTFYLEEKASSQIAEEFLSAAESAMLRLVATPRLCRLALSGHQELRIARIARFQDHMMFNRPLPDGIEVIRVVHGAMGLMLLSDSLIP